MQINRKRRSTRNPLTPRTSRRRRAGSLRWPGWLTPLVAGAAFVTIAILERRRPLRPRLEPDIPHLARNLGLAGVSAVMVSSLQGPVLGPVHDLVERKRLGILARASLPLPVRIVSAVVLLDYTLWFWHWLNHRVGFLWRFHLVHHADLDLDSSTAIRFHFGELSLSLLYRALQLVLIGPDRFSVALWQMLLFVSIFFHHSNLRLPLALERRIVMHVVTPRMHAIHHSDFLNETDSNWSSLLSWWDRLHGTLLLNVPQERITIGVPAWEQPSDVTFLRSVAMPFGPRREDWRKGDEGVAVRPHPGAAERLAP